MRFKATFDIWPLSDAERAAIQPGQWITAGPEGPRGQYLGQKPGGSDVVCWNKYASGFAAKRRVLRQYAIAK